MDRSIRLSWLVFIVLITSQSNAAQHQKLFGNHLLQSETVQQAARTVTRSEQVQTIINEDLLAATLHQQFQLDDASKLEFKAKTGNAKQPIYQYKLTYKNLPVHNYEIAVVLSPTGNIVQGYGKLATGNWQLVSPKMWNP